MQKISMMSSFVWPDQFFEFERCFLSITTISNLKILIILRNFTIQVKTVVEHIQKVTEPNLVCDRMELGDLSQAKTLSTEFDANLTTFHGISSLVVDKIYRKSPKIVCLLT